MSLIFTVLLGAVSFADQILVIGGIPPTQVMQSVGQAGPNKIVAIPGGSAVAIPVGNGLYQVIPGSESAPKPIADIARPNESHYSGSTYHSSYHSSYRANYQPSTHHCAKDEKDPDCNTPDMLEYLVSQTNVLDVFFKRRCGKSFEAAKDPLLESFRAFEKSSVLKVAVIQALKDSLNETFHCKKSSDLTGCTSWLKWDQAEILNRDEDSQVDGGISLNAKSQREFSADSREVYKLQVLDNQNQPLVFNFKIQTAGPVRNKTCAFTPTSVIFKLLQSQNPFSRDATISVKL